MDRKNRTYLFSQLEYETGLRGDIYKTGEYCEVSVPNLLQAIRKVDHKSLPTEISLTGMVDDEVIKVTVVVRKM